MNPSYSVDEIIDAFCRFDGTYRRAYVDAALAMREEITPRLIGLLEMVRRKPDLYAEDEAFTGHMYAAMLLAYFRETRAHRLILDLFSLRDDLLDALWDDMITEDLPTLLYRTCGGDLTQIKALAGDRRANEYCRSSAASALAYAAADGVAPREEIVTFFGPLLDSDAAPDDSSWWGLLIGVASDLYPKEILLQIRRAFDDDLVEESMIGYEDIESALNADPEAGIERLRAEMQRHMPDDFHGAMDWWAMFEEEPAAKPGTSTTNITPPVRSLAQGTQNVEDLNRQQRRKLERQQAKASKKAKQRR
jgi:hypothetical protein